MYKKDLALNNQHVLICHKTNHLTVCKQMSSGKFKMLPTNYLLINHERMVLNNLQRLICHKTQPTQKKGEWKRDR